MRCPDAILTSAQNAASNGHYGYTYTSPRQFTPYMGDGLPAPPHNGVFVLEEDQIFLYNDTVDMYNGGDEREAGPGTEVYCLFYGRPGNGFWRVTAFKLPDGRCFELTET